MYKLVFAPQAIEDLSILKNLNLPHSKKLASYWWNFRNTRRPELESLSPSPETEWANGPGVSPKSIDWSMK